MGYKEIELKVPSYITESELKAIISRKTALKNFSHFILRKSLDARQKQNIVWLYRIGITSKDIKTGEKPDFKTLDTPYTNRKTRVAIVGSGPAGIFAANYLLLLGYKVTLIEQGNRVEERKAALNRFENTGEFSSKNNYAFGEGGAGTFSDGKLTSRTKSISAERNFIFQKFIESGAPDEIFYMTHPHLGSDNLFKIAITMRNKLKNLGGTLLFNTQFEDLMISENQLKGIQTSAGPIDADFVILATGHSSYPVIKTLIGRGIPFRSKNFAIGFRAEHHQEIINVAQWGVPHISGVKAAEYRLTSQVIENMPVYSFCMCPGGKVVPAMAFDKTNIVNGMSDYSRDGNFANAAVVAGINLEQIFKREVTAVEAIDWLDNLEKYYFECTKSFKAPAASIQSFLNISNSSKLQKSTYPFDLVESDFNQLLPPFLIPALKAGLTDFTKKLKGYETGTIIGLESKTSSPVQVIRHPELQYSGYENLYIAGEGGGWSGGIVSSAADGLKMAQALHFANA